MSLASVISETSVSREKEERRKENTERMRMMRETMRACMRARVCLVVESVIDLFREEAGISGLREGSVEEEERGKSGEWGRVKEEEREREKEEISRVGGEKGGEERGERDDATMDGWMDERVVTTPARALADLDCSMVNARMTACSSASSSSARATQRRRKRKRERGKTAAATKLSDRSVMRGGTPFHSRNAARVFQLG